MFQIIISNVGTVWAGENIDKANCIFDQYRRASQAGNGRVSSENVTLLKNGYIVRECRPLDGIDDLAEPTIVEIEKSRGSL